MRSDDASSSGRIGRILRPVGLGEPDDDGPVEWPAEWPPGAVGLDREVDQAWRSRWQVPPRAGLLIAAVAVLVVAAVPVTLLLGGRSPDLELPDRDPAPRSGLAP